ncbi:S-protein homolog 4-like [Populus nigra]|uniref:S-protein homolog 4-like n=1 Tax=Populus nigra TaxID=3691 RepID=UPI002B27B439|nr:S-protein homolog 4-like [Populus nigra]
MTLSDACCTKRTQLSITNDLDSSSELLVHCKPRNYDLGLKSLSPHCSWSFDIVFRLMWIFVLVFACNMVWNGQSKLFDIYTGERDGAIRGVGGWPVLQTAVNCFPWKLG